MPSDFGSVSKAYIEKPNINDNFSSTINTLSLYVLGQNNAGQLTTASNSLKNNLRTYLSQYKIIGDSIEIKDAFIINISIDFEIIVLPNNNNNTVILNCITSLKNYFSIDNWQINEPIILRDLYVRLDKIEGVQTVKNIEFNNKTGVSLGYSQYAYDIPAATQNQVIYPSLDPSIFEVKYPNTDIKGKVVPL
jgi:phage-related baseplate assembly protein